MPETQTEESPSAPRAHAGLVPETGPAPSLMRGYLPAIMAATLLLLCVLWGTVYGSLCERRDKELDAEARQNLNIARLLAEQTTQLVQTVNQATLRARDEVLATPGLPPQLVRYANETGLSPRILVQLALADADGQMLASNLDPSGSHLRGISISDREHFLVHAKRDEGAREALINPDALFVSRPVLGKVSKRWTIQLSRRITDAEGRFRGVIVASVDPGYFEALFRTVDLGRNGTLTLIGRDRVVRARVRDGRPVDVGATMSPGVPFERMELGVEGSFISTSSLDQTERQVAFREVAGTRLAVLVATATSTALESWQSSRNTAVALGLATTVALLFGAAGAALALRRLDEAHRHLLESEMAAAHRAHTQQASEYGSTRPTLHGD
jgi:hypothetical protein